MQLEITDSTTALHRVPLSSIRWTGILAGLVVGLSTHLLLMLVGASVGLAAVDVGDEVGGASLPAAVGLWNTVSMVVAAFVGAYVAARSAGMRRASDGILHGVVAWGVTLLVTAFLATTAAGALLGTFFGSPTAQSTAARAAPTAAQAARAINEGDRAEAISSLQTRLGLSPEQAARVVDQALIVSGQEERASPEGVETAQETLRTASIASGWLTAAILLSLLAAMGGGWLGARGTHRVVRAQVRTTSSTEPPSTARVS